MSTLAMNTRATSIPCLKYRDAQAAIRWLCETFGFTKKAAYEGPNGGIAHAELTFGNGMIMLGSASRDTPFGELIRQPGELGGKASQSIYMVTSDPDEIYRRARAGGSTILIEIKDENYGGRGFTCTDLEGHIWSFGSYDPWRE